MTRKEERFVSEYLSCLNATEAARRAGYSERTAKQAGYKMMSKPAIRTAIDERLKSLDAEKVATQAEVMEMLTRILRRQETETVISASGKVVTIPTPISATLRAAYLLLIIYCF